MGEESYYTNGFVGFDRFVEFDEVPCRDRHSL
jgi:hypothetical protein